MAAAPSIRVVKTLPFKNGSRNISNRYHFTGGTPADATHWHTLMDAVTAVEKTIYYAGVVINECFGYAAGSDVPVASKTYSLAGTHTRTTGSHVQAGEVAALARWSTAARSTKNHPIYCFSYWHGALVEDGLPYFDHIEPAQAALMATYAGDWVSGFSDGSNTYVRSTPSGHTAIGSSIEEYVTHRDFPYTTSL